MVCSGGHVAGRPEHRAIARQRGRVGVGPGRHVGNAEVDDAGVQRSIAARLKHDVLGLEIAVDDTDSVGRDQCIGDLAAEQARLGPRQRSPGEAPAIDFGRLPDGGGSYLPDGLHSLVRAPGTCATLPGCDDTHCWGFGCSLPATTTPPRPR